MTQHDNEIPNWDELFPGTFNAGDFEGGIEITARIETIRHEMLTVIGSGGKPTGEKERKPVVFFGDHPKRLVLNRTNAALIGAMHGKKTSGWIGKRITMHAEPGCGFGRPGVRVCGSPDIAKEVKVKPGLPPKPDRVYTLRPTGQQTTTATTKPPDTRTTADKIAAGEEHLGPEVTAEVRTAGGYPLDGDPADWGEVEQVAYLGALMKRAKGA